MKTIEEKYQEMKKRVLEIGRGYVKEVDYSKPRSIAEYIDPELKEGSEDERIRKDLISYFKYERKSTEEEIKQRFIPWLEKQKISEATTKNVDKMVAEFADTREECTNGKPVNCQIRSYKQGITDAIRAFSLDREKGKTEPKLHEGEWLIDKQDNTIFTITKVLEHTYKYVTNTGKEYSCTHYSLELDARPWDYNDAKDGDVLVDKYNNIGIFQKRDGKCWYSHIYLGCDGELRGLSNGGSHIQTDTRPATKEQRDLLFTKMKEAGYKWDAEKKELKNLEQKPAWDREDEQNLNAALGYIDDEYLRRWLKDTIYNKYENPSEWSEEDEKRLNDVTKAVNHLLLENGPWLYQEDLYLEDCPVWLKSLKGRVQSQPKQEWSEADENIRIKILEALSAYADYKQDAGFCIDAELIRGELVTWLKSLKGRVQSQLKRVWNRLS